MGSLFRELLARDYRSVIRATVKIESDLSFDAGDVLPRLPPPVDFDAMSLLRPLVAAFGLVCELRIPT